MPSVLLLPHHLGPSSQAGGGVVETSAACAARDGKEHVVDFARFPNSPAGGVVVGNEFFLQASWREVLETSSLSAEDNIGQRVGTATSKSQAVVAGGTICPAAKLVGVLWNCFVRWAR